MRDFLSHFNKVTSLVGNLLINLVAQCIHIGIDAVKKTDTHGDGAHIKVFFFNHFVGLFDLEYINH